MKRVSQILILFLMCIIIGTPSLLAQPPKTPIHDRAKTIRMLPDLHLLEPIWSSPIVHRESLLPLKLTEQEPITGRLAFPAQEILKIKAANGTRTFELGKDVQLVNDGKTLNFQAESVPGYLASKDFYPPAGSPNSYKHRKDHPEQNMIYAEGHWFHDRQIEVTYRRQPGQWTGKVPAFDEKRLPKTLARLKAKQPLTIGVSGDSITQGFNATAFTNGQPGMPPYSDLVAAQLEAHYGSKIQLKNRAISGWSITHGHQDLNNLLAEKPQLVIVAYGMNDVGKRNPQWFHDQTQSLVKRIQDADPNIEIILVSTMLGNSEWIHTPREMFALYRDELAKIANDQPGIVLADLTNVWDNLLKSKHDLDLIGNGLNHPNDFGHRLYAQVILASLIAPNAQH